jgi:hypothetical protein
MNRQVSQKFSTAARASVPSGSWVRKLSLLPLTVFVVTGALAKTTPDSGSLAGSWSGGGWVSFASGNKEKARCHANYSRAGSDAYTLNATCATSGGKASQTATVYKVSDGRYRGSFFNSDFNVHGTIRVAVHGSSQDVSLSGDGASASLSLSRR